MKLIRTLAPILPLSIVGCAGLTGPQYPAPVYRPAQQVPAPKPVRPPIAKEKSMPAPQPPAAQTFPLEPEPPPAWATPEPTRQAAQLSPVAVAMLTDAERNVGAGHLDSAAAALERGLRIEPRNATLMYKLAEIRLKQAQPTLAEDLAKKSALLAGNDQALKKRCWLLIAEARKQRGDSYGAREAELKAQNL